VSPPIAFVLKGYPRFTETFVAQEILALEKRGIDIRLFSLRSTGLNRHPIHNEIRAPLSYMPEYLHQEPGRIFRAWRRVRRKPGYRAAKAALVRDFFRHPTPNRLRNFGQAMVLADELPADVKWLHAHFLHAPATVVRYAAMTSGLPWSCSAHAIDIWTSPDWEKRDKLRDCRWAVTCTRTNMEHLGALAPTPESVELVYHGLDFSRFPKPAAPHSRRDGKDENNPVLLLSVGRAVDKKGYAGLIDALSLLPKDLSWRFVHIGSGGLLGSLKRQAQASGISERITWLGELPQDRVIEHYQSADVFVLASRVSVNGDKDGLPNVLMEAQSQSVACLTTSASAAPELILDGETGFVVAPDTPADLAERLERLIRNPELREQLGTAGTDRVRSEFSLETGIDKLAAKFGQSL